MASIGKVDAGLEVLKIAAEMYPKEANLYDSIGEFYLKKGDKQSAIVYYRKALEVDPKFENARQVLEGLLK